jgi:hypothetical protein
MQPKGLILPSIHPSILARNDGYTLRSGWNKHGTFVGMVPCFGGPPIEYQAQT